MIVSLRLTSEEHCRRDSYTDKVIFPVPQGNYHTFEAHFRALHQPKPQLKSAR